MQSQPAQAPNTNRKRRLFYQNASPARTIIICILVALTRAAEAFLAVQSVHASGFGRSSDAAGSAAPNFYGNPQARRDAIEQGAPTAVQSDRPSRQSSVWRTAAVIF